MKKLSFKIFPHEVQRAIFDCTFLNCRTAYNHVMVCRHSECDDEGFFPERPVEGENLDTYFDLYPPIVITGLPVPMKVDATALLLAMKEAHKSCRRYNRRVRKGENPPPPGLIPAKNRRDHYESRNLEGFGLFERGVFLPNVGVMGAEVPRLKGRRLMSTGAARTLDGRKVGFAVDLRKNIFGLRVDWHKKRGYSLTLFFDEFSQKQPLSANTLQ